jgi:arginyl-tRNA synthetase
VTPEDLAVAVLRSAAAALADRGIDEAILPAATVVERSKNPVHGDYASSLALQLAREASLPGRELAEAIAAYLRAASTDIERAEVAGPGFINITLRAGAIGEIAGAVVAAGSRYGHGTALAGERINLEFVSANPTGPVHIGGVRWAAYGDALGRILRASGATVCTEYYFNDAGLQIDLFARSLLAAARNAEPPADGYTGEYVSDISAAVTARHPEAVALPEDDALRVFRETGIDLMFGEIKDSLRDFGVSFDVYFAERLLHERGELHSALARLADGGYVYQENGATWIRTSTFGEDKDRVYMRSDGTFTYFAADCAYFLDKRARGFDRVMIILGADHHGYVGRMRAVAACFGDDPDRTLEILIGQMVNLVRDGQPARMSKRAGTIVTLADLTEAIGVDTARYALARYALNSTIDLDLDLWTRRGNDNPVYYVQYAHARIASVRRAASAAGVKLGVGYDPQLLIHNRESDLLLALAQFPAVVASAADLRHPHRVARYLEELAGTYHRFHDACRILPRNDQPVSPVNIARLGLAEATRIVLANGLELLGVSAPDRL